MFINPIEIKCEHCGYSDKYNTDDILAYKSECFKCKQKLKQSADDMHASQNKVSEYCSFTLCVLDICDFYKIEFTDPEIDKIESVNDFVVFLKDRFFKKNKKELSEKEIIMRIAEYSKFNQNEINLHDNVYSIMRTKTKNKQK